jgi:hypothetical protein
MLNWSEISPSEFEKLCFRLVSMEGFQNVKLYGGSGDRARDIVGEYFVNTGASVEVYKFMIQCKRFTARKTIGVSDIVSLKNWMDSNHEFQRGLIIATASSSPNTRDWLDGVNNGSKYRIEIWDASELEKRLGKHPQLKSEFFSSGSKFSQNLTLKELRSYRKKISSKSIAEQVRIIKDETSCYIRGIIVNNELAVVTYVDFGKGLREFEMELINVITIIGKMYSPSSKYRVTINNNMLMSNEGTDYSEMLTAEVPAAHLEKYILGKITLGDLWKGTQFYIKEKHIGNITLNKFDNLALVV